MRGERRMMVRNSIEWMVNEECHFKPIINRGEDYLKCVWFYDNKYIYLQNYNNYNNNNYLTKNIIQASTHIISPILLTMIGKVYILHYFYTSNSSIIIYRFYINNP